MRIPSQFNEDPWYRRSRQRTTNGDWRRVTRLVLALLLVLVLMRQAAKPVIYEQFFSALTRDLGDASAVQRVPAPGMDRERAAAAEDQLELPALPFTDPAITASVVDGTVWRAGDFPALYEFLSAAPYASATPQVVVGVLPLLQQPEMFRNRVVQVAGEVVRSERIAARDNQQGIEEYWQLWLRPVGGVQRPLVVIAAEVPPAVAAIGPAAVAERGPLVRVSGRFLKRLAYRSRAGADLAPVIVGSLIDAESQAVASADRGRRGAPERWLPWGILASALVSGVGAAAWIMWRTAVLARRTRAIRHATASPAAYLQTLSDSDFPPDGS